MNVNSLPRARLAVAAAFAAAALAGACGVSQALLFQHPSGLKYALTIIAPMAAVTALCVSDPPLVACLALVAAAPFAAYGASASGVVVPLYVPLLIVAVAAIVCYGPLRGSRRSALGVAAIAAPLLLAIPAANGTDASGFAELVAIIIGSGYVVASTASDSRRRRLVLWTFGLSAALQSIIALWEARTGQRLDLYGGAGQQVFGPDYFFGYEGKVRAIGTFYDPISLGNALAVAVPITLGMAATTRSPRARLIGLAAAVTIAAGLAVTLSRMSWIGAAAGVVVTVLVIGRGARRSMMRCIFVTVVALTAVGVGVSGRALTDRLGSILHPTAAGVTTAAGDQTRIAIWQAALQAAESQPIAGTGIGRLNVVMQTRVPTLTSAGHAHSTYLELIGEAGAMGALTVVIVALAASRDLARGGGDATGRACAAGACAALAIVWATDYTIRFPQVAIIVGGTLGLVASLRHDERDLRTARRAWS